MHSGAGATYGQASSVWCSVTSSCLGLPRQVVLHDTPGVVTPSSLRGTRHENRVRSAWNAAGDADLLVYLVDAQRQVPADHPGVINRRPSDGVMLYWNASCVLSSMNGLFLAVITGSPPFSPLTRCLPAAHAALA